MKQTMWMQLQMRNSPSPNLCSRNYGMEPHPGDLAQDLMAGDMSRHMRWWVYLRMSQQGEKVTVQQSHTNALSILNPQNMACLQKNTAALS